MRASKQGRSEECVFVKPHLSIYKLLHSRPGWPMAAVGSKWNEGDRAGQLLSAVPSATTMGVAMS